MFDSKALGKVSQLLKVFSNIDRHYPIRLSSWKDFRRIPICTREDLKTFVKKGLMKDAFNVTATSGSTSSRLLVAHSPKAYKAHLKRLVKIYQRVGVKKGMLCLNLCSYELNSGGRLMEAAFKAADCGVIPLGPISTPNKVLEAADLIRTMKPDMINAYTNQLFDLFDILGRRHSIRQCLVNGEPLWPAYRKRIELMGAGHVHDHYGAMEISGLAVALKPNDEYMRVVSDGLLLEVMDVKGESSETGIGALLVTDLNNTSMPIIRYHLGDRVELLQRQGALWIKILSRTEDSLLINGVVVLRQGLIKAANDFLGHPNFFFVLEKNPLKYNDKLIVNVIGGNSNKFQALAEALVKATGMDRCLTVNTYRGAIPRTVNGKIRYFIDTRKEI